MKHMEGAKKRKGWRQALALLITLVLVCGLAAPAYAEGDQETTESTGTEQVNLLTNETPVEAEKQCACGSENGNHMEGCPLYVAPKVTSECNCGAEDGKHAEGCPLYVAPEVTPECNCGAEDGKHAEGCPLYVAPEVTPECNCGAEDGKHAEGCPLYVAPEVTPECNCGAEDSKHAEGCPLYVAPEVTPECNCGAEDGKHAEGCPLYVAPEVTPECNCGAEDGKHAEGCPLYVAPEVTPECNCGAEDGKHAEGCPLYVAPEATPECNCGSEDGNHTVDCPLYVAPEEETEQDPAVTELYEKLLNSKTLEEFAAYVQMEEYEALSEQFTEEQWVAVNAKYEELSGIAAMLLAEYTVTITDTIKKDGRLTAALSPEIPNASVKFIWQKNGTEVERQKVTGNEYNLAEDGSWLNVAYDNADETNAINATYSVSRIEVTTGGNTTSIDVTSDGSTVAYYKALQNGSFETPKNNSNQNNRYNGTNGLYWKTTDVDHGVEIVSVDYGAREVHGVVTVPDGTQAAEINAEDDAALYQDVLTTPGSTMYWSLMHMGRIASAGFTLTGLPTRDGKGNVNTDTMYVVIMPTATAETGGNGGGEVDTYSEVAAIMNNPGQYPGVQVRQINYTWYWVKSSETSGSWWDNTTTYTYTMHYVDPNGNDTAVGSVTKTGSNGSYNKSNFKNVWQNTTGSYVVPDGQFMTRYFFVSGETAAKNNTIGNMVDEIWFSTEIPKPAPGTANLSVQKTLEGVDGMTDEQLDAVKNGLSFTVVLNGVQTSLSGNQLNWNGNVGTWYTSTQVPANSSVQYSVTENSPTAPDGYKVTLPEETTKAGSLSDQGNFTASFTNTYAPANTTLTIKKTVTGGLGDRTKQFDFTVTVKKGKQDVGFTLGGEEKSGEQAFKLKDGGQVELVVPIGSTVTVTESDYGEDHGGYTTTYAVPGSTSSTNGRTATWEAKAGTNNTITFTNDKEASPDTGVILDSLPYVLILGAVAVVAVVMVSRKRRDRDAD